jgi:hypothetical protein
MCQKIDMERLYRHARRAEDRRVPPLPVQAEMLTLDKLLTEPKGE